ncbi:MAG: hypothetical protein JXB85_17230 [Anaerolineales bacterium]|nr:hypothetical protein [Anaerolineales bacterium]
MNTLFRKNRVSSMFKGFSLRRGLAWGLIIIGALLAFEIFNYSTTEFALTDVLGDLRFAGIRWAAILAIAFCGIDFAGIARLFTPEKGRDEPAEVWYLFGAWLLAAGMNALLTWWGVKAAIVNNATVNSAVISHETLIKVVPVFVAVMVWLIRVLIIGTFSIAGERLFSQLETSQSRPRNATTPALRPASQLNPSRRPAVNNAFRPAPKARPEPSYAARPEPTYHNLSMNARSAREAEYVDNPRHS